MLALAAAMAAVAAQAEITYHVTVDQNTQKILVDIQAPSGPGTVSFQIPNWSPGAYSYGNFYENVADVTAADAKGVALTVTHPDNNTWVVPAPGNGPIHFDYSVPTRNRRFGGFGGGSAVPDFLQISGPSTYMYVVGRKNESCRISFTFPAGWLMATGLDESTGGTFTAPTYDVLADCPVSAGNLNIKTYQLRGKTHYVVLMGAAKDKVDVDRLTHDCRAVSAAETDFWGGAPYKKYVWHFSVFDGPDGAGGLEHLNGTQITLSSGEGPRAQSVLFHEYFHLWNVKRIRSFPLGPFNYLELPKTGALWWLEGVTDYYASLLPYRYGLWNRGQFFDLGVIRNLDAVRGNPARLQVSAYDASYRVADANNGRGNSNGYQISYYNLGWLAGMLLDIEIRANSGGKHSLDDVAHALFQLCKDNKPGFQENEIRNQCVRFGGPSLGDFYDRVVMKPGEMPVEEEFAKVGLKINETEQPYADYGFQPAPSFGGFGGRGGRGRAGQAPAQAASRGIGVRLIHGPAEGQLEDGDIITTINGTTLDQSNPRDLMAAATKELGGAEVGKPISLKVKRGDQTVAVQITPVQAMRKVRSVVEDPGASLEAVKLREQWLANKTPSVQ